jgi:hypothetical protein
MKTLYPMLMRRPRGQRLPHWGGLREDLLAEEVWRWRPPH